MPRRRPRSASLALSVVCSPVDGLLDGAPVRALERQEVGQFGDLAVEALEHGVAARDLAGEEELRRA